MAITSQSQILELNPVYEATAHLDEAISLLRNAKTSISNSKMHCGVDALDTDQGNSFPDNLQKLMDEIDNKITELRTLKDNVISSARNIRNSEQAEYNAYLERKRKEEEEAARAAAEANKAQAVTV